MDVGRPCVFPALKGHSPELLTVQFLETVVSSILLIFLIILAGEYIQYFSYSIAVRNESSSLIFNRIL